MLLPWLNRAHSSQQASKQKAKDATRPAEERMQTHLRPEVPCVTARKPFDTVQCTQHAYAVTDFEQTI